MGKIAIWGKKEYFSNQHAPERKASSVSVKKLLSLYRTFAYMFIGIGSKFKTI